jgi:tetrahydromethanopterin S-methyltransferase subunit F
VADPPILQKLLTISTRSDRIIQDWGLTQAVENESTYFFGLTCGIVSIVVVIITLLTPGLYFVIVSLVTITFACITIT